MIKDDWQAKEFWSFFFYHMTFINHNWVFPYCSQKYSEEFKKKHETTF